MTRIWTIGLLNVVASLAGSASAIAVDAPATHALAVEVENHSVATKCAEEDNVYYTFQAPPAADGAPTTAIGGFRVEATGVPYLPILRDSTAPDFTDCSFGHDYAPDPHPYVPPTATLYEDDQYILKGIVYPDFWRPTVVPVTVGHLTQKFLHLVQLWKKTAYGPEEFLVFYPNDGYWRLKTLPPIEMREVAYGSSFLLGPIQTSTRPFVAYKAVAFDPATLSFQIAFETGGSATVTLADIRTNHAAIDVAFDHVTDAGQGVAGLRSMYVTTAVAVTFGRSVPSTHNTSAPDIEFSRFVAEAQH
jgi:hypothetical protein